MATARDLFQSALVELGAFEPGEAIDAADISNALDVANDMLASWSNENLTCYAIQEQSFPLVINKSAYTIGSTGSPDVTGTRPLKIIQAYLQDFNQNIYGIKIFERDRWNEIGLRQITSQIPSVIFYDPQYPLGIINIFPIPLIDYTLYFDSYLELGEFTSQLTQLSFPLGYKRALRTNLAVELADSYGITPTQNLLLKARESKANVKRKNTREIIASYEGEIVSRPNATYNIHRDSGTGTGPG